MSKLIDQYLLFRIRTKRDPEAFAQIYDRYVEAIYRFVYLKVPKKEDAQDIAAETFTRAWQHLAAAKEVVHIRAFLYQIARNLVIDFYRARKPDSSLDDLVTFEDDGTSTDSNSVLRDSAQLSVSEKGIESRAELGIIFSRIAQLKEDYRDVLLLRLVDDLPFNVIADILGKSTANVRVIYHRALKALNDVETSSL
jgi:RNA polymerase sigma-70 factor (ECF subfamily)